MTLDILDVVQLGGERVGNVNDNDFPICFTLVEEGHDAKNLDLLDLAGETDLFTDLANVERIVVALGLSFGVSVVGVFPGLEGRRYLKEGKDGRAGCDEPEGRRRSSRCNHGGGSSCERNANGPF